MGAWGPRFDENEAAADWLADFSEEPEWEAVDEALAVENADYLEAPEASVALVAVEVVAAGLGKPSPRIEPEIAAWAAAGQAQARSRRQDAILALRQVRDDSELQELWQQAAEGAEWLAALDETMARL